MAKKRNMTRWRKSVIDLYGPTCAASRYRGSDCAGPIEAHHLQYRSQGGQDVTENGLPLCTRHHSMVHARRMKVRREWLHESAIAHLAEQEVVAWDDTGRPFGRHWKGFAVVASG